MLQIGKSYCLVDMGVISLGSCFFNKKKDGYCQGRVWSSSSVVIDKVLISV